MLGQDTRVFHQILLFQTLLQQNPTLVSTHIAKSHMQPKTNIMYEMFNIQVTATEHSVTMVETTIDIRHFLSPDISTIQSKYMTSD